MDFLVSLRKIPFERVPLQFSLSRFYLTSSLSPAKLSSVWHDLSMAGSDLKGCNATELFTSWILMMPRSGSEAKTRDLGKKMEELVLKDKFCKCKCCKKWVLVQHYPLDTSKFSETLTGILVFWCNFKWFWNNSKVSNLIKLPIERPSLDYSLMHSPACGGGCSSWVLLLHRIQESQSCCYSNKNQ